MHGNKLWLSELLSVAAVGVILACLLTLTTLILVKGFQIRGLTPQVAALKHENVNLLHELEALRSQDRLVRSLRSIAGARVPEATLYQLVDIVYRNSTAFGYDPLLVLAVIHVESVFDPRALGQYRSGAYSGAMGLMQLKFGTAQLVARGLNIKLTSEKDLLKPEVNLVLGITYLTRQISQFKSFKLGLLAYNQGPGVVAQSLAGERPLSINYYNKVLNSYFKFLAIAGASS